MSKHWAVALAVCVAATSVDAGTRYFITPSVLQIGQSEQRLSVRCDSDETLVAFSVGLTFDPDAIEIVSVSTANPDHESRVHVDEVAGTIRVAAIPGVDDGAIKPGQLMPPGTARELVVLTVTPRASSEGATLLRFDDEPSGGALRDSPNVATTITLDSIRSPDIELVDATIDLVECPEGRPEEPRDFLATAVVTGVALEWSDASATETSFEIERKREGDAGFAALATVSAGVTSYIDEAIEISTTYSYRVRAVNDDASADACRRSGFVESAPVTTPDTVPVFAGALLMNDGIAAPLPAAGASAWYAFGALEETTVDIKLKFRAAGGATLGFELALFDESGAEVVLPAPRVKRSGLLVKKLVLFRTSTYFLRLRGGGQTVAGAVYELRLRGKLASNARKKQTSVLVPAPDAPVVVPFHAVPGALVSASVKGGARGVDPDIVDLREPGGASILPVDPTVLVLGTRVEKIKKLELDGLGKYELTVSADFEGLSAAPLKARIKLKPPRKRVFSGRELLPLVPVPF